MFTIERLKNGECATLENYKTISFDSGYQVSVDDGIVTNDYNSAWEQIQRWRGSCGVWFSDGFWYIDKSINVSDFSEAMSLGRKLNQISIYDWANDICIKC